MDADVANFLIMLLNDSPVTVSGAEVAKLADVHARAVAQVRDAVAASDDAEPRPA